MKSFSKKCIFYRKNQPFSPLRSREQSHPSFAKKKQNPLITGTLMLTGAGLLTRAIGFFHRIYLSQLIGAKEMGIYQMIFPIYMLAFALCCHGMELALSQMIAAALAKGKKDDSHAMVSTGIFFSLVVSLFCSVLLYHFADAIGLFLLKEQQTALCLRLMAPVLPFTAIRCCLHGYYLGQKKTLVPSLGQLIEQLIRVCSIWFLVQICNASGSIHVHFPAAILRLFSLLPLQGIQEMQKALFSNNGSFTAVLAVCGMVIGEMAGTLYTYISYKMERPSSKRQPKSSPVFLPYGKELLRYALPLTGNKLSLTFVSSLESVLIPIMLTKYYQDQDIALSMYGVLTGMALPFILFPSTLTNSLSVMLLPAISEAHAAGNHRQIRSTIKKTVKLCLFLGFTALFLFFCFGKPLGTYVFHNPSAGDFLFILSFLCPFLYLSSSGTSILNGLGFLSSAFCYNLISIGVRIGSILFLIPKLGMQGYLFGLLGSYLILGGLQWRKIGRAVK